MNERQRFALGVVVNRAWRGTDAQDVAQAAGDPLSARSWSRTLVSLSSRGLVRTYWDSIRGTFYLPNDDDVIREAFR